MYSRKSRRTKSVPVNIFFVLDCATVFGIAKKKKKKKKKDSFVNRTEMCFN